MHFLVLISVVLVPHTGQCLPKVQFMCLLIVVQAPLSLTMPPLFFAIVLRGVTILLKILVVYL